MTKKYIDQAVVIEMAKPYWQTDEDGFGIEWLFDKEPIIFKRDVEAIPATDVEPVRHGKWEFIDSAPWYHKCNQCQCFLKIDDIIDGKANYCPNCGAKMDDEP